MDNKNTVSIQTPDVLKAVLVEYYSPECRTQSTDYFF